MTDEHSNFHMLMQLAVRQSAEEEFQEFHTMDASDVTVHPRIRRKVKAAVRKKRLQESVVWRVLKRTAAACLVIVTAGFVSAMCIQPVRAAFWNAIVHWYDDHFGIILTEEAPQEYPRYIKEIFLPEVPDGWTMEAIGETGTSYVLLGPNSEYVTYQQRTHSDNEVWYNNKDCEITKIELSNQQEAYLFTYQTDNTYIITWLDEYEFTLIGEFVTAEELISIAKSVK